MRESSLNRLKAERKENKMTTKCARGIDFRNRGLLAISASTPSYVGSRYNKTASFLVTPDKSQKVQAEKTLCHYFFADVMRVLCLFLLVLTASDAFLRLSNSRASFRCPIEQKAQATPIDGADWPDRFPAKEFCSRCGLCETTFVSKVTDACAFLGEGMGKIHTLEEKVHGRRRNISDMAWSTKEDGGAAEEGRFGVLFEPVKLAQGVEKNAQWTGCVTGIALSMLESNMVDAVVCIASQESEGWASPEPILARTTEDVLRGRGVKPALAPSLKVLDDVKSDPTIKKLLFCGVGCAVQGK